MRDNDSTLDRAGAGNGTAPPAGPRSGRPGSGDAARGDLPKTGVVTPWAAPTSNKSGTTEAATSGIPTSSGKSGATRHADRVPVVREVDLGVARLLPDLDHDRSWLLTIDEAAQSYVDLGDPTRLEFEYVRRLGHLVDAMAPPGRPLDVLHLGGGAFSLPRYIAATRPGSRQQVVEADAALTALMRRHLPWQDDEFAVVQAEARAFVTDLAPPSSVDLLVVDVFGGDRVPAHLTSLEFTRLAARVVRPHGWYAVNFADGPPLDFARGQAATVRAVWPHTQVAVEPDVLSGLEFGNLVVIGGRHPLPAERMLPAMAADPYPSVLVDADEVADGAEPVVDATATGSPEPPPGAFEVS